MDVFKNIKNDLLIVESPNKIKKIQEYVGKSFTVSASKGHIRNIDPKDIGIDMENDFAPKYIVVADKKGVVKQLKMLAKKSENVWLAMDYDREGEAIAWHVKEVLNIDPSRQKRIVFTEITKNAIINSIKNPKELDMNMFYSQQARMILDKIIGYKLSPLLWNQFKNYKLSAGRVQSVIVRIIRERELEIEKFESNSYYKLLGGFNIVDNKDCSKNLDHKVISNLLSISDINTESDFKVESKSVIDELNDLLIKKRIKFIIDSVKKTNTKRQPPPPYITSTLQQDASVKLGMSPTVCMKCAQKLYESGFITYMRTDSLCLSDEFLDNCKTYIDKEFGEGYYRLKKYTTKSKNAQEAHEACRPTNINIESVYGKEGITSQQNRLYRLIRQRSIASQMKPAEVEIKSIKIKNELNVKYDKACNSRGAKNLHVDIKKIVFNGKHEKITFDGYYKIYKNKAVTSDSNKAVTSDSNNGDKTYDKPDVLEDGRGEEDEDERDVAINKIIKDKSSMESLFSKFKQGQELYCQYISSEQKDTKPPHSRYTEASLIKKLEELGIGRPSTYASMINKVQDRKYVEINTIEPKLKEFDSVTYIYPEHVYNDTIKKKTNGEKKKLFTTGLGNMISKYLESNFTELLDYNFTANVEALLDEIAKGNQIWNKVVETVYTKISPIIDNLSRSFKIKTGLNNNGVIQLGINPENNNVIRIVEARYGPVISEIDEDKNIRYAGIIGKPEDVTLADAIECLKYPKNIGEFENNMVQLCRSKNYYIRYNNSNLSIENYNKMNENNKSSIVELSGDIYKDISLDDAIKVIKYYRTQSRGTIINNHIRILNGKYGYYIKYKETTNIPIPFRYKKNIVDLNEEICKEIIEKKLNPGLKEKKGGKNTFSSNVSSTKSSGRKSAAGRKSTSTSKSTTSSNKSSSGKSGKKIACNDIDSLMLCSNTESDTDDESTKKKVKRKTTNSGRGTGRGRGRGRATGRGRGRGRGKTKTDVTTDVATDAATDVTTDATTDT